MNQYELAILYDSGLEIDLEKATSRFEKIISDNKGKIINSDNWGVRKLAYPIKKHESAVYVIYTAELPVENVRKVEKTLHITDEVIRFLITKPDLKAIAKAEVAKAEKAKRLAEQSETEENQANEPENKVVEDNI
jgi:small subunit ribosomal protein S6